MGETETNSSTTCCNSCLKQITKSVRIGRLARKDICDLKRIMEQRTQLEQAQDDFIKVMTDQYLADKRFLKGILVILGVLTLLFAGIQAASLLGLI